MNPFDVLEISADASNEDIKAAYHRLAKRWHPDRYSGKEKEAAEAKFRELAEAFSMLKDPGRRLSLQQQHQRIMAPAPAMVPARAPEAALERTPEDWAAMAREAFSEGKVDQARALIHYAIRMDGAKAPYHAFLAALIEQQGGDIRTVIKALETAVQLDPKDVESHLKLAGHFQDQGLNARAQRHLDLARELAPNHPKFRKLRPAAPPQVKAGGTPGSGKGAGAPPNLMDQLRDLWGRLTGRG